jgi:hypothetical protein
MTMNCLRGGFWEAGRLSGTPATRPSLGQGALVVAVDIVSQTRAQLDASAAGAETGHGKDICTLFNGNMCLFYGT